jgi:hypothetical protein
MRTQILHLESYDDRHSISDKLEWGQAERAILIWPLRGQPLANKLDLKLIHRRCQTAGMKLALVCRDPEIKEYAQGLNIPVFRSLRKAQQVVWEYSLPEADQPASRPERKYSRKELDEMLHAARQPGWADRPAARMSSVAASVLALLALAIFLVPSARITYLPKLETQSLGITLQASPEITSFNLSGTTPVDVVTVSVEGRASIDATGSIGIANQLATGLIEFTNVTNQPVTVPAGTVIRTADPGSNVRFITVAESMVDGQAGATINVPIEAVNPGVSSNVPANVLVIIDGSLSLSLTANNPQPTSGGTEQISPAPSLEDYDNLHRDLIESLWANALTELRGSLDPKDMILYDHPYNVTISEESYTPEEPQPSETLSLLLRVEFDVLLIRGETLQAMGNAILDATLPEGYSSQPESLVVSGVSDPVELANGTTSWEVVIFRQIFTSRKLPAVHNQISGKSAQQAAQILVEELELSEQPVIEITPSWWPWLPWLKTRITIIDLQEGE